MIDLPSVRMSGAFNHARARVLWRKGIMRAFDKKGFVFELGASEPQRTKGWLRTWVVRTFHGDIKLKAKCSTCGGWSKITRIPAEELWEQGA